MIDIIIKKYLITKALKKYKIDPKIIVDMTNENVWENTDYDKIIDTYVSTVLRFDRTRHAISKLKDYKISRNSLIKQFENYTLRGRDSYVKH